MTEAAVKSIMRLFAIAGLLRSDKNASDISKDIEHTRTVTEAFLYQLTNPEKTSRYLQIFDFHIKNLYRKKNVPTNKRLSVFSVKVLLICEQLNDNLNIYQKTFLLLQLFDIFKNRNNLLSNQSIDFLNTIAQLLYINSNDFDEMFLFVFGHLSKKIHNSSFLIISGQSEKLKYQHHLYRENMKGIIVVFHLTRLNQYFFRIEEYDQGFTLNAKSIFFERIYLFEKGFAIRSPHIQTIHHTDVAGNFLSILRRSDLLLVAEKIEYQFTNSENGIKKFNFVGKAGELIGIMGGSGVGKSTLLNILNGNLPPQKGNVFINNIDIYNYSDKVKGLIGFIPQDDLLIEELTVFENLLFNAKFCFSELPENILVEKINSLLKDLSLYEIKDLTVGTPLNKFISGGQRKRLNIALELLREPAILFVDEPTSGLSSKDSEKVMELLKQQTYSSKLVIVNIHQPSSNIFKMFDKLLVLDKGGYPVYYGNTIDSLVYFKNIFQNINSEENECAWCGNINPEQILDIIETVKIDRNGYETNERLIKPEDWYRMYLQNIDSKLEINSVDTNLPQTHFKPPKKIKQFIYFLQRNIKCKLKDTQYLIINLLEAPILAIILAFFTKYYTDYPQNYVFGDNDNIPAFIFMSVVVALFLGMMVSAEEIIRDAKQIKRETFLNLSHFSYNNSKVVYLFLISAFQMLVFVIISHIILDIKGMVWNYWLILFSTSCFANMLGLNLSAGLKSVVAIYIFIPLLLIPQLLLSGTIVKFDKLHPWLSSGTNVPIIGDMMASRWAYEAITVEQFKSNRYEKHFYELEKNESNVTYVSNYWIPELLNKVEYCNKKFKEDNDTIILELLMLKDEIQRLAQNLKITPFKNPELFDRENFNEDAAFKISGYLRHARNVAIKILNNSIDERDKYTQILAAKFGSHDKLVEFKKQYYNEALAEQLLNKTEPRQIIEHKHRFYRKYEPVFFDGENFNGRAHYYAPTKRIGNIQIDTFIFNFFILWFMSSILYITLHFNVVKKITEYFERFKIMK